jgi:hypothetical protein
MCEVATVSDGQELGRMKDAQLEQIEPGAAVHLSLEQFQPVDVVFPLLVEKRNFVDDYYP